MRHQTCRWAIAVALVAAWAAPTISHADGPGLFGRIFKKRDARNNSPAPRPNVLPPMTRPAPGAAGAGAAGGANDPAPGSDSPLPFTNNANPAPVAPNDAPGGRPREATAAASRPITEADPLLTRVSLIRGDRGQHFGVFLQIYMDGTVVDSQGVHRLSKGDLAPIVQAIQACDVTQRQPHCGGQSSDYLEAVQFVVYDRSGNKLRAHAFSCSGDFRGCDQGLQRLQVVLDELMAKLSGAPAAADAAAPTIAERPAQQPAPDLRDESQQLQIPTIPGEDAAPPPPSISPGPGDGAAAPTVIESTPIGGDLPALTPPAPSAPQP